MKEPTSTKRTVSARDLALILVSASLSFAVALSLRLPTNPDMNNLLGLIGSLIGAALAVAASLVVLARQFETTDERQLRTMRALLSRLRGAGAKLTEPTSALDPARHVREAFTIYHSTRTVAVELQANGPTIAIIAQKLEGRDAITHLHRMIEGGAGVAAADMNQRGEELISLADELTSELGHGL